MISKTAEYALKAVLRLAQSPATTRLTAAELAESLQVPQNYLSKILHTLSRSGVLDSVRGPHGGFRLAVPTAELSLATVIEPFDELTRQRACLLGRPQCLETSPCAAHHRWRDLQSRYSQFFRETTVAQLLGEATTTPG
ncbi:MAG TPA: Rrf2 family transcriptional regulator [Pseudomonadales bacterium]